MEGRSSLLFSKFRSFWVWSRARPAGQTKGFFGQLLSAKSFYFLNDPALVVFSGFSGF